MSSQNGGRFKTEKECRKEEIGITKNEYIKDGKLIVETREFTQGVCFYYKKDKLTKETYKIIKEK